jgi:hypothetical protein
MQKLEGIRLGLQLVLGQDLLRQQFVAASTSARSAESWGHVQPSSQKITFGELRDMGVRGVLVYCAGYR